MSRHRTSGIICLVLAGFTIVITCISYRTNILFGRTISGVGSGPTFKYKWCLMFDDNPGAELISGLSICSGSVKWHRLETPPLKVRKLWGFEVWHRPSTMYVAVLRTPLWLPLMLFLVDPFITFVLGPYCRYLRRKKGHCVKCGYNLTGNTSGICPECGEKI